MTRGTDGLQTQLPKRWEMRVSLERAEKREQEKRKKRREGNRENKVTSSSLPVTQVNQLYPTNGVEVEAVVRKSLGRVGGR